MLMLQCTVGDMVQYVPTAQSPSVTISRVELDSAAGLSHRTAWWTILVPRLYAVATVVHQLRQSTSMRQKWLAAVASQDKEVIVATLMN